jgi:hypothetical protein
VFSYGGFFGQGQLLFDDSANFNVSPEGAQCNSLGQRRERETMNDERGMKGFYFIIHRSAFRVSPACPRPLCSSPSGMDDGY